GPRGGAAFNKFADRGGRGGGGSGGGAGAVDRGAPGGGPGGPGYGLGQDMEVQEDTIFVSNMGQDVTEEIIIQHFGSIGVIKTDKKTNTPKVWIYKDKLTNMPKGEATVTFDDSDTAKAAIDWFDGKDFQGRVIKVELAQRQKSTFVRGGGRGGGSVGRGGGGGGFGRGGDRGGRGGERG
ncbi:unnamed protein product, partial [Candidula unifasciata]